VRSQIFPRINVEKLIYPYEAIGEKIWIFSCWAQIVKYNKTLSCHVTASIRILCNILRKKKCSLSAQKVFKYTCNLILIYDFTIFKIGCHSKRFFQKI
jgi:hypothetical protein